MMQISRSARWLVLLALLPALPACLGGLLPKAKEKAVYALPAPAPMQAKGTLPGALLVELPRALAPLDGVDIIVRQRDGELQTLPGVRWAAPAPELLQDLIARQIETAGAAPGVALGSTSYALPFRLSSDLQAFEIQDVDGAFKVQAQITLRLICERDARVLASSEPISVEAAGGPGNAAAATAALREAAGLLARQVVFWLRSVDVGDCA